MKTIRLIEKEDLKTRYKAIVDPKINEWLMLPNVSFVRTEKWFQSVVIDINRRDFVGLLNNNVFGFSGLTNISPQNKSAEVYIFLASPKYYFKSLGSWLLKESIEIGFKELGVTKFSAKAVKENVQSRNFFLKNNFKQEGILEKESWINGSYHDIFLLAKIFKERV